MRGAILLLVALLPAGCLHFGRRPTVGGTAALLGPTPSTILILPPEGGVGHQDAATALMLACERALIERGYVPVPVETGLQVLERRGYTLEVPVRTGIADRNRSVPDAAKGLNVDACLALEIRTWKAFWRAGLEAVDYHIVFRLLDAEHGDLLFERQASETWMWRGRYSPVLADERDAFTGIDNVPDSPYRTTYDFVTEIAITLVGSLPLGPTGR